MLPGPSQAGEHAGNRNSRKEAKSMTDDSVPVAPLSIWKPVHLGTAELGQQVHVTLPERNMRIGGEPGGGKSVALQLPVAHGALSPDCHLVLIDGKRVELGL